MRIKIIKRIKYEEKFGKLTKLEVKQFFFSLTGKSIKAFTFPISNL